MDSYAPTQLKKNPRENASWFSLLLYFFTFDILRKGYRKGIEKEDVYEIVEDFRSRKVGELLEKEWIIRRKRGKTIFLFLLFKIFWKRYVILLITLAIVESTNIIFNPILIGKIISYFTTRQTEVSFNEAWLYALGLIITTLIYDCYMNIYFLFLNELYLKIRAACCALIYRKCLRLSENSLTKCASGLAVTLITKDLLIFEPILDIGLVIVNGVFQAIVLFNVMYSTVGIAGLLGVLTIFVAFPIQAFLGHKMSIYRLKTAATTDKRVTLTQEILTAMRIIKMYTWELFFTKSVDKLRKEELGKLRILFYIKAVAISIGQLSARFALYVFVVTYVALGNHITAEKAFFVTGCLASLRTILTVFMPMGISNIAELKASLQRLTDFLELEEAPENSNLDFLDEKQPRILLESATVKSDRVDDVLQNINLEIKKGLTVLTGSVGAGKSTLLKLILSDIKRSQGQVKVSGKISYASQEPWLFPATVKQNIIFGNVYDENRYETIIRVCALKKDFNALPLGDRTILTDKGLNLSRGQKARINLARAVYKAADIYLLDDCLSAVDAHVGKHIYYQCIKEFLKEKVCILVTHHSQFLEEADYIVWLDKGNIMFQGNYSNLKEENNKDLMSTIIDYEQSKEWNTDVELEDFEEKFASNFDNEDESSKLLLLKSFKRDIYEESKEEGAVKKGVYLKYFTSGGGIKMLILLVILFVTAQAAASWSDYFVSYWVTMEEGLSGFRHNRTTNSKEYTELEGKHGMLMWQYSAVILAAMILTLLKTIAFFTFATISSKNMHNLILDKILNAPMIFFDKNLSGNVLNRFSRDLGIIDEQMPYAIQDVSGTILTLLATFLVVSSVNLFFLIPSIIFVLLLLLARHLYIPTGRSIRRLEGATRSPVIGHLNASLEGLTTIRAHQAQNILKHEFDRHLDLYNSVTYMHISTTRAFGFYLDTLSSFYITVITFTFLFIKSETLAGQVGLAITQSFSLTGLLQHGVRQWAELENQMTSTERILEYSEIKTELKAGDKLRNWPHSGEITYSNVNLRYNSDSERVLKNISFQILPMQKIGVVGRTGAGKSSLIASLFRMYEYTGSVIIDDVDISSVRIEILRSKISIIPQDPVLFSGTVRSNLDPNNRHPDKVLWDALEEVEMKNLIGSLNSNISEGGANFSTGQRQLLCLARAIVRKNIILVLDEATANVDPQTDCLIQRTIKNKFADCTIITIAHRLHTIMDCDNVLVMDSGVAVEYDHPEVLLENKGLFYEMVKDAGLL